MKYFKMYAKIPLRINLLPYQMPAGDFQEQAPILFRTIPAEFDPGPWPSCIDPCRDQVLTRKRPLYVLPAERFSNPQKVRCQKPSHFRTNAVRHIPIEGFGDSASYAGERVTVPTK